MKPRILILHATGTNRDREAALACRLAGGQPEIVHLNQLVQGERWLRDYQMLLLPGGFSYGDDLGAGRLWAVALRYRLGEELAAFVETGRPVLGICNGFQALVKAGLLPGLPEDQVSKNDERGQAGAGSAPTHRRASSSQQATLTRNDSACFECRWVYLLPETGSPCLFTQGLEDPIYCPAAHGEGKFVTRDQATLKALEDAGLVAMRYARPEASDFIPAGGPTGYPWNPNGSQNDIAGICNAQGNVLGMMPHPEDHILPQQHPRVHRGQSGMAGLPLIRNGVRYAAAC